MLKLKNFILLAALSCCAAVYGQTDFQDVDTTTYRQYINGDWKHLIRYGRRAKKAGQDFYYLNMRVGIAHYNKLHYDKAAMYFRRALKNDSYGEGAKEYLFWSDLLSGDTRESDDTYLTLADSVRERIKYKIRDPFQSLYLEGGIKISNNTQIANHVGYAQVGLSHKVDRVMSIYHAYTFQRQKQIWGSFFQHQYLFATAYRLKKNLTLNVNFHYSHYSGKIDFTDNVFDHSPPPANPGGVFQERIVSRHITKKGTYKENLLLTQFSVSKTIKGFTIAPHAGLFLNFLHPDFIDSHRDTITIRNHNGPVIVDSSMVFNTGDSIADAKETRYEAMFGVGLAYNFGRLTLGADVTVILNKTVKTAIVTPYMKALLSKHVGLSAFYMYKGAYPLALFDGSQLYNSLDKIKYKASVTGEFYLPKNITLYATYQFEGITDSFSSQNYQLHTLLIGLNLKL